MAAYPDSFPLSTIRHSAAHVLAQAVLQKYPNAKLGIGPAIDEGFYYDFDLDHSLTPEDLTELEKSMKAIIKEKQKFTTFSKNKADTLQLMQEKNQPYKVEIVNDLNVDTYSFYENGPFLDLCRGPHVDHTGQIGAIKLLRVSGAYWRGSEKNKMLQRIYGTAFHTKEELKAYLQKLEEAQKRDHRVLGKQLDLFSIEDEIGGGLILWHPKGAKIRHFIESYWKEQHIQADYDLLYSPHIGRAKLWETSGHLGFYDENMYSPIEIDEQSYYLKPMNCPFHILTYQSKPRSYRELPIRYAELGTVYRYERSGVLHGLMRVRGFTQDDAHIICTEAQVIPEIQRVLTFCLGMLRIFGFTDFQLFLSTRPEEKYVGDLTQWSLAQDALKKAMDSQNLSYDIDEGGGAFYGPKIDIKIKDAIGREWQCSTIQFDFNLPERFQMSYVGSDGNKHQPYMIHRALLGSIERFFGILIEHYAGKFPLWLAPIQIKILTIATAYDAYAEQVAQQLKAAHYRVETDFGPDKIGYKIRQSIQEKVPYMLIIGQQEQENNTVTIRSRDDGELGAMTIDAFGSILEGILRG